jgi:hypothetical protein
VTVKAELRQADGHVGLAAAEVAQHRRLQQRSNPGGPSLSISSPNVMTVALISLSRR